MFKMMVLLKALFGEIELLKCFMIVIPPGNG